MENYIQNIDLINKYLNKSLTKNKSKDFEKRLKIDIDFNKLYEEQVLFLEGLKRQTIKVEIKSAKQYYVRLKWFKFLGISVSFLIASMLTYVFLFHNNTVEPIPVPENNNSITILDSISFKDHIQDKRVVKDTLSKINKEDITEAVNSSNRETKNEPKNTESFKKGLQIFAINPKKDTTITCKEGTKLIIKPNSFVDTNNAIVEGKINIGITEYYKLSDMLLANLTTKSNDKQLETGGMLLIEAKKDEVGLKLKENSSIEILFPKRSKKDNMQLFSGEWEKENINWELQKSQDNLNIKLLGEDIVVKEFEEDIEVPFAVVEQVPIFPGCENLDKIMQRKCVSDSISEFIRRKFNTDVASVIGLKGRIRINTVFKINQNGVVVPIQSRANHPILEEEASRVIALLPKMIPGKQRGKAVTVPYSLPIIFQVEGGGQIL
ncbi:MAG: hypothetical protein ACI9OE_000799 [Mariniflexile sp.]|jgi:hypothetical protein